MTDTILLTGISGFIAKHIALKLLNAGYAVRSALRPHLTDPAAFDRLSFVATDLEQDAGWPDAMAGVLAVIHTASPFPIAQPKDEQVLIRPAVDGTRRVLLAAGVAGITRVILTSSDAAIIDDTVDGPQDEADWCALDAPGTTAYARSNTLAERAAWAIAAREGLSLTTINPGLVIGPPLDAHYGSSIGVVKRVLCGKDPMLPDIGVAMVDVRDVAEMHLRALQRPATTAKRYAAVAGSMTMPAMGRTLKASDPQRHPRGPAFRAAHPCAV